jgi:hypothetical protein
MLILLAAIPASPGMRHANDVDDLVRRAVANYQARQSLLSDYTYLAHCLGSHFDRRARRRPLSSDDYEVMFLEGEQYMRHTRHNDQPLPPDQEKQEEIMMESFAKARREAKSKPGRPSFYTALALPVRQLADDFNLRRNGKQRIDSREVDVIEALPMDGQGTGSVEQEHARHFKIKLWIDAAEAQIVKIEAEVVKDLLVKDTEAVSGPMVDQTPSGDESKQRQYLYKRGATLSTEWTKLSDGAWLPKHRQWKAEKRVWLELPNSGSSSDWLESADWTYSGYKKFRIKTTIVP